MVGKSKRATWRGRSALVAVGMALVVGLVPAVGRSAQAAVSGTTRFVPVSPTRILDTRPNAAAADGPKGYVNAGAAITLQVTTRGGVPADATAVVMNVTATETGGAGFITVWPTGEGRPDASNLNVERVGQTIPNLVVVQLGAGGAVNVYAQSGAHLIADVSGYFTPAAAATGGRFVPTNPTRVLDTRDGTGARPGIVNGGETVTTSLFNSVGPGYSAAVLNVTATDSTTAGFVTVWPGGAARPDASNLNLERAGQTIPNLVIVPVGPRETVSFYAQNATNLVADLVGLFTDDTAGNGTQGLFIPQSPERVLDTRKGLGFGALGAGQSATLTVPTSTSDVGAVLGNVTATEARSKGFITVWPGDQARPGASSLNVDAVNQTIPNLVISGVSAQRTLNFYSQPATQLLMDVAGVFTTSATVTPTPPTPQGPASDDGSHDRFKIFYVYPTDRAAPADPAALQRAIKHEIALMQQWVSPRADNRVFRLSGVNNIPDVIVLNDQVTAVQQTTTLLYDTVVAQGLLAANEYAFFFVKDMTYCGEDKIAGKAAFVADCGITFSETSVWPNPNASSIAENMLHALGVVPTCALHSDGGEYLNAAGSKRDIMYEQNDRIFDANLELDANHTEYYGHGRAGCYDLKNSSIWTTP